MWSSFISYFPFKEIRDEQRTILEAMDRIEEHNRKADANKKIRYIVIEAGTGVGKSAIAKSIIDKLGNGYIITSTKSLQDQYIRDFKDSKYQIASVEGRANYSCIDSDTHNCSNALCAAKKEYKCHLKKDCYYFLALAKARKAVDYVTSYAYFLAMNRSENNALRDVVVLDEAHNLEGQLLSCAEFSFTKSGLEDRFKFTDYLKDISDNPLLDMSIWEQGMTSIKHHIQFLGLIQRAANYRIKKIQEKIDKKHGSKAPSAKLVNELINLKDLDSKITPYLNDVANDNTGNWIVDLKEVEIQKGQIEHVLDVKPLEVNELFFKMVNPKAKKYVVFMSATILDPLDFLNTYNIPRENTAFIRQDSPFPPERSPIILDYAGLMTYKYIDDTLPKMLDKIEQILNKFPHDKGIIHTVNYRIARYIVDKLSLQNKIRVFQNMSSDVPTRKLIQEFKDSINGVLITPAASTGESFDNDLCRFQIICKLPYASLGDKRIKVKSQKNWRWYSNGMIRILVQTAGRATRNSKDWSCTYILDEKFDSISQNMLPPSFTKRIVPAMNFNLDAFLEKYQTIERFPEEKKDDKEAVSEYLDGLREKWASHKGFVDQNSELRTELKQPEKKSKKRKQKRKEAVTQKEPEIESSTSSIHWNEVDNNFMKPGLVVSDEELSKLELEDLDLDDLAKLEAEVMEYS